MPFTPPKGIRPPQLEGRRVGRPKGSRNWAKAWRDALWGYTHVYDGADPPTAGAAVWRRLAEAWYDEVEAFLQDEGLLSVGDVD